MFKAHRHGDGRACGATTVVQNQSTVFVNGKLWAIRGTVNSHGAGGLINTTGSTVLINGIPIIVYGPDHANPDTLCPIPATHCDPFTTGGSPDVFAY